MRGSQSLRWLVLCVGAVACTDGSTPPRPPEQILERQLSKAPTKANGPVEMFGGAAPIASATLRASAAPSAAMGGQVQAWADIDCRSTFTNLDSCRESYVLEAASKGQFPGAVGRLRGWRVAKSGSETMVYELDARLDCLTIGTADQSTSEPSSGENVWVSGPVLSYTLNGKPLPNPGGTSDVLVRLVRTGSGDSGNESEDRAPRGDDLGSLLYNYVPQGCSTQTPVAVTPRALVRIERRRANGRD